MLETLLSTRIKNKSPLDSYKNDGLIEFLSKFSTVDNQGVQITEKNPNIPNSVEEANFNGYSYLQLGTPNTNSFVINDGDKFVLETYVTLRDTSFQHLFGNLTDGNGSSSFFLALNNEYQQLAKLSFNVCHFTNPNNDLVGTTRYFFGLGEKIPVGVKTHIKLVCNGKKLTGFINGVEDQSYVWHGGVVPLIGYFRVGGTLDNKYMVNGVISEFRFLKY